MTAVEEGSSGNDISVEIHTPQGDDAPDDIFTIQVKRGGRIEETFEGLSSKKGKQNAATVVNAQSKLIQLEEVGNLGFAERRPAPGAVTLAGGAAPAPARVRPDDYVGDSADRTGFGGLEAIDDVTMVSVPDLMAAYQAGMVDLEGVQAVQLAMIAHCELMGDRVAILDPPPGLNSQQIREWRVDKAGYDSKYATLYWPWIKVFDPLERPGRVRAAVGPHGRRLGPLGRHARRAQGARERGRPRRALARDDDHEGRARPAEPRRDQRASGRSRVAASASGARARSRATRPGGTSTSAGSSTTSRSRS